MGQCTSTSTKSEKYRPLGEVFRAKVLPVHGDVELPGAGINVGLCVSGGGCRAMSFSTGVYRALNELDVLGKLDAISSVSGGTWCSSILMFAKEFKGTPIETAELLGKLTVPADLTMEALKEEVPLLSGVVNGDSSTILKALLEEHKGREYEVWPKLMSEWLLRNFDGLDSLEAYMALEEDLKRIREDNPQLEKKRFLTPRTDKPRTFIMNGCSLAPLKYEASNDNVVSFQMCPDFTGSPFYPQNQQVKYSMAPMLPCKDFGLSGLRSMNRTMGGGFTETFAFGGAAPKEQSGGQKCVLKEPSSPFALPYAVGISSWAAGGALNQVRILGNVLNIRRDYWPVTSDILPKRQPAISYQLGDGGSLDNAGLLALLQRGARKVIWVSNSWTSLNLSYDWDGATPETFNPQEGGVVDQVFCTFGYDSSAVGFFYANNQVFERSQCLAFCRELKDLKLRGKPVVVNKKLSVLPNAWWGIKGGYEVELVLVYLDQCRDFEAQLPTEMREEIAKEDQGAFANFPIYPVTRQNEDDMIGLTPQQAHLLAAQAEYSVRENEALLRKLLS